MPQYTIVIASGATERLTVDAKFWPGPHAEWLASQPCWSDSVGIYYETYGDQVPLNVESQRITTSVAYLALDGEVVGIVDVMAHDSRTQIPVASTKYAVQVRRGLFSDRAVKVGDRAFVRNNGTIYQFPKIPRGG